MKCYRKKKLQNFLINDLIKGIGGVTMHYEYKTKHTCATKITFDIKDENIYNVKFTGGCDGNLKAVPLLIEGWKAEDVVKKLRGLKCGGRQTSCTDQLSVAITQALEEEQEEN